MSKAFSTVSWAIGSNIYEVNIRQYTTEGTFSAFASHLPRLKAMGVEILWLMPITPISKEKRLGSLGSYYACSSYVQVNSEFGNLNDFKNFVQQAQQQGFKVIIDWVANHTGWDHEWTILHPEWYLKDAAGNFTEQYGWNDVIDLDYRNNSMREAMINAMQFWVNECGIDGFRCDMAHLVPLDFWHEARKRCDNIKPLFWLAECEVPAYHEVFDVSYAWALMHITEKMMKGEASLQDMHQTLHGYSQYMDGAYKLFFTANHDENSWNGTEYEKYGKAAKAFAVFTCTWRNGIPLLYSGQELPNKKRLQFFEKDVIEWKQEVQLHSFYRLLFGLHKTAVIAEGELFILPTSHANVLAFLRKKNESVVLVLLNFCDDEKLVVKVDHPWLQGSFTSLFSSLSFQFKPGETFELMAHDYAVYHNISIA